MEDPTENGYRPPLFLNSPSQSALFFKRKLCSYRIKSANNPLRSKQIQLGSSRPFWSFSCRLGRHGGGAGQRRVPQVCALSLWGRLKEGPQIHIQHTPVILEYLRPLPVPRHTRGAAQSTTRPPPLGHRCHLRIEGDRWGWRGTGGTDGNGAGTEGEQSGKEGKQRGTEGEQKGTENGEYRGTEGGTQRDGGTDGTREGQAGPGSERGTEGTRPGSPQPGSGTLNRWAGGQGTGPAWPAWVTRTGVCGDQPGSWGRGRGPGPGLQGYGDRGRDGKKHPAPSARQQRTQALGRTPPSTDSSGVRRPAPYIPC